jgi:adenylate cyclase
VTAAIASWLLEARGELVDLIEPLVARLADAGVPLARIRFGATKLHPEIASVGISWNRGAPASVMAVTHTYVNETRRQLEDRSPIPHILYLGVDELHVPITPESVKQWPPLAEIQAEGMTDYFAYAMIDSRGRRMFVSFSTDAAAGFTEAHLAALRALRAALTVRTELFGAHDSTRALLEVYLGKNAAGRVLGGSVRRGTGVEMRAVIWFCDLRGFTTLVDRTPVADVVQLLDAHFERVTRPVIDGGGEVLKYVGDAALAVFAVDDDPADACRRAIGAATSALDAVNAAGDLRIGVALHLGDVMYGNIGASDRLDFTVIGRAVNEVCRVESLCKEVGAPLLVTSSVAEHAGGELVSIGRHGLRGVADPVELFTLQRFASERG